jgi:hypothetical protein
VRTKTATEELADKLAARGYAAAALNGDMNQGLRERVIEQLKNGTLDIVVATDVAARGLDVPRASATSSTTTCPTTPRPTCTASAAPAAPAAPAWRSCSWRRARTIPADRHRRGAGPDGSAATRRSC